jgi:hypothetical protein
MMVSRKKDGWKRMPLGLVLMIAAGAARIIASGISLVFSRRRPPGAK